MPRRIKSGHENRSITAAIRDLHNKVSLIIAPQYSRRPRACCRIGYTDIYIAINIQHSVAVSTSADVTVRTLVNPILTAAVGRRFTMQCLPRF